MRKKRDANLRPKIMGIIMSSPGCTFGEIGAKLVETPAGSIYQAVMSMERSGVLKRVDGKTITRRRWFLADREKDQVEIQQIPDERLERHLIDYLSTPTSEEELFGNLMDAVSKIVDFKLIRGKKCYEEEIEELKLKIAKFERAKDPYLQKIFG